MEWHKREPVKPYRDKDVVIEKLAKIRGIKDIKSFLNPEKSSLISPYLLKNLDKVKAEIMEAVYCGRKITISNDVDTDGCTSTASMYNYLKNLTDNVYIAYHQRGEGHGVENQLHMIDDDTDLLIIIDSSSNSVKACRELSEKGMKIVIIDHHEVECENPHAVIVNPQQEGCDYYNKKISASGLTYKMIQALDDDFKTGLADRYMDLAAVGLVGDMMDMFVMDNRYMVAQGMKHIRNTGLKAILEVNKKSLDSINSQTIGFTIAPMINGAARLEKIELALELLTCTDKKRCMELANEMFEMNKKRKKTEISLYNSYAKQINEEDKVIIVTDTKASKGFNGLVANRIAEKHKRPTMVLRDSKGSLRGSYRTYGDFPMKTFLDGCKHIEYTGGHIQAGGVGIHKKNLDKVKEYINNGLKDIVFNSSIEYDLELEATDVTTELVMEIEKFDHITGTGFPSATFLIKEICFDKDERKVLGDMKNTIKIVDEDITLMKFNTSSDYASDIPDMSYIEVVGQLNLNVYTNYYGHETITNQVFIEDYRID